MSESEKSSSCASLTALRERAEQEIGLLLNKLVLAAGSKGYQMDRDFPLPDDEQITDADIDRLEGQIVDRVRDLLARLEAQVEHEQGDTRMATKAGPIDSLTAPTSELLRAEAIARLAHFGQVDKAGNDYIQHVERVVAGVESDKAKAVAWLHDVLEDSDVTCCDLARSGIADDVIRAVKTLTRDSADTYSSYIALVQDSHDPLAIGVKLADLHDHLTNPGCPERLRPRYESAQRDLVAHMPVVAQLDRAPRPEEVAGSNPADWQPHQSPVVGRASAARTPDLVPRAGEPDLATLRAQVQELQASLDEARSTFTSFAEHHAATELSWDADKAQLASLQREVARLQGYVQHKEECASVDVQTCGECGDIHERRCTCGLLPAPEGSKP